MCHDQNHVIYYCAFRYHNQHNYVLPFVGELGFIAEENNQHHFCRFSHIGYVLYARA